ncbi:MAG: PAS domain S-box protein [Nannocystis sp.]|uniref:PAS domain-containing sensor histidine kinase n=1 Tax=Nannocystis sp. TaxID=1962667 RepID=UPI0024231A49|nr:ATP-binding protein [Nannocystis sp.]MBK9755517.1 PAS domain S-box protein [Nannocystis sp.]
MAEAPSPTQPALRWLAPPIVADEDEQRTARLLHAVLLGICGISVVAGVLHLLAFAGAGATRHAYLPVFLTSAVLLLTLRRGHTRRVALALPVMLWLLTVFLSLSDGGLLGPSLGGQVVLVLMATLLLSRWLLLALFGLCLSTVLAFLALEWSGSMPARTTPDLPELALLARSVQLGAAGLFLHLAVRTLQDVRRQARAGEARADILLREANAAREYANNVLSSMAESLVVLDARGVIQTVNKAASELLGQDAAALVGRPFTAILPDYGAQLLDHRPQHDSIERSYRHHDGRAVPVLLTRSPLRDENGRLIGSVCVASDISQLKEAERSLREAKQIAEEASLAKSRFLANMSHELRTPLNAVIGYAEMLLEESEERGLRSSHDELRKVQFAGKHLLGLISDILDLSKIEAGRMDIHLETFDVADMVETVLGTVRPMLARNNNQLVVHCPPAIGFIHADLTKIRQILLNLLSNAAKFTERGTVRLSVARHNANGPRLVFTIADTGIGMTQGQVTQLFQAFSQADPSTSRRFGGTGLGLAISKAFTDMLGGNIEVQSKLGAGTIFTVRLPYVDPLELSLSKRPPGLVHALAQAEARRQPGSSR